MSADPPTTGGSRRDLILAAAARLLSDGGIGKTSVARIAREAGVAVGSVYLEFAGKDAIVEALSLGRFERVLSAMRAAAARGPWPDRLQAAMERRTRALLSLADDGAHGAELLRCCCPGAEAAWRAFRRAERALIADLLAGGRAAGDFAGAPALDAATVLRAYQAFTPPALLELDPAALDPALAAMHRLVLDGLCARR